ncbi:hypothetical protein E2C01_008813 [Portunus trituberculatus]|uniref:Uncharacterized protein n=1 Tax=Portunus trituberculatus TaxID=210409 RepID=A0A5B7D4T4_PORTR|nr:hypothetical protein [Portunus trituberculatus]
MGWAPPASPLPLSFPLLPAGGGVWVLWEITTCTPSTFQVMLDTNQRRHDKAGNKDKSKYIIHTKGVCEALVARGRGSTGVATEAHHTATLHQSPGSTAVAGPRALLITTGQATLKHTSTVLLMHSASPQLQAGGKVVVIMMLRGRYKGTLNVTSAVPMFAVPAMALTGQAATVPPCSPLHPRVGVAAHNTTLTCRLFASPTFQ